MGYVRAGEILMEYAIARELVTILEETDKEVWLWKGSHLKSKYQTDFNCSLIVDDGPLVIYIGDEFKEDWIEMKELTKITIHKRINLTISNNIEPAPPPLSNRF